MLRLDQAFTLLEHDHLPIEAGYGLTEDGMIHIAASTYMKNVTPEMIDWWFTWCSTTEQYKLWHPRDHIGCHWEGPTDHYIGRDSFCEEFIGGVATKLAVWFVSPGEYFGPDWAKKFEEKGYGTAVCARIGTWDEEAKKYIKSGHLVHLVKIEPDGGRMRSRFWLGDVEGLEENQGSKVPAYLSTGLLKHCTEEMAILATILPGLYEEHGSEA